MSNLTYSGAIAFFLFLICNTKPVLPLPEAKENIALSLTMKQEVSKPPHKPGPRGALIRPAGEKLVRSVGNMGLLLVEYSKCEHQEARTISIDVWLRPAGDNEGDPISVQSYSPLCRNGHTCSPRPPLIDYLITQLHKFLSCHSLAMDLPLEMMKEQL